MRKFKVGDRVRWVCESQPNFMGEEGILTSYKSYSECWDVKWLGKNIGNGWLASRFELAAPLSHFEAEVQAYISKELGQ